jgi:phosphatidate cytidylyltransferase
VITAAAQMLSELRPHLDAPVVLVLFGLWAFLITASGLSALIRWRRPGPAMDKVMTIARSWWFMAGLATAAMVLGEGVFIVLLALVSVQALKEFFALMPTRHADHRALFWTFGAVPVQYVAVAMEWELLFLLYVPLYHFLVGPLRLVLRRQPEGFMRSSSLLHWGLMLNVFCLSHVAALLKLPIEGSGAGLVVLLLVLTELNDVSQFLWGKSLGKRKVLPEISPNKTWAGLLGGIATTSVLSALLTPVLSPAGPVFGAILGCALAMFGFSGDVVLSAIKRDVGAKDFGELIPGHGGVLDRVDSLTFTAPLLFWAFYLWGTL